MFKKLRLRFITSAMISVAAVLVIIIGAINLLDYQNVVQEADRTLEMIADNGGSFPDVPQKDGSTSAGVGASDQPEDTTASSSEGTTSPASDAPTNKSGTFGGSRMTADTPFESRYFTVKFDTDGTISSVDVSNIAAIDDVTAKELAQQVLDGKKDSGFTDYYRYLRRSDDSGTIVIFLDCNRSLSNFRSFFLISILVSLFGFAAVLVLVILLSRRATRPIQESYEKQKRFITDAGHELKTPLTVIDADLSVLEMDTGKSEWIDDVRTQTKRLTKLTNDLVYLSKMDEENRERIRIDFPLSDIVTEEAQSFRSRALVENKSFESSIEPMINYNGDERAIRQLVSILLDNALKYSEEGGSIRITLSKRGKTVFLTVFNTTAEIRQEDLGHLFDRFYRADRSRNSETGGYGLGLSIAQAVVSAHKGRISAESQDGHSLTITAQLPC